MNGRVLQFDDSAHRNVDLLLPWLVNGTLSGDELASVLRHVDECPRCQREVESLRALRQACLGGGAVPNPAPSWHKLQHRLRRPRLGGRVVPSVRRLLRRWKGVATWARWAMAAELALVVGIGALLVPGREPVIVYQTLGTAPTGAHNGASVVVMFDSRIAESELRRIVREAGSEVIEVPTETGAYVLHVPAERQRATIDFLHRQRGVVLAEPLAAEIKH